MAYKAREEIVGKRFLSVVNGFSKLKPAKIAEWGWRAGVIRAATHKDNFHKELQVLVEYDDVEWHRREWISIYKDGLFHMFMVEQGLCWAERSDPYAHSKTSVVWPALTFLPLVSTIDLNTNNQPVEFLLDRELSFKDYKHLKPYQDWDTKIPGVRDYPDLRIAVKRWAEQQDGQRILLATPSVLVGYRVEVYRAEGTTQWYTAVIVGYNEATRDLTVTDDTVLEEHNEDPALVQMRLIGDGVVESIMRGENVGITPRRSRSTVLQAQQHQHHHHHHQQTGRIVRGLSSGGGSGGSNVHGAATTTVSQNTRKQRSLKPTAAAAAASIAAQQQQQQQQHHHHQHESIRRQRSCSPEPPDKVVTSKGTTRKRKTSENESSTTQQRLRNSGSYSSIKEDLENKQARPKKNGAHNRGSKKKVLEEANNSKLREVQRDRVDDCLQNASNEAELSAVCRRSAFEESVRHNTKEEAASSEPVVTSSSNNNNNNNKKNGVADPGRTRQDSGSSSLDGTITVGAPSTDETVAYQTPVASQSPAVSATGDSAANTNTPQSSTHDANDSAIDDDTSNGSSVQLVPVVVVEETATGSVQQQATERGNDVVALRDNCGPAAVHETTDVVTEVVSEEDDCVIVAQRSTSPAPTHHLHHHHHHHPLEHLHQHAIHHHHHHHNVERECSSRGDDDGPLSSSSPFSSRMELAESVGQASLLRFPDDRSDSGVSSLRSGSGDERSGSRSSALSSSDEPPPQAIHVQHHQQQQLPSNNRSPLFIPSSLPYSVTAQAANVSNASGGGNSSNSSSSNTASGSNVASEPVRVWRDPSLLLESEPHVRHIHSVQHQSLLMSHPSGPAASGPPPTSAAANHPATLYAPMPTAPSLMAPHHVHPHALAPPGAALYAHGIHDPLLWKTVSPRYPMPMGAHLLPPQAAHAEELLERDRVYAQDRDRHERLLRERQNQETRELEKQKEREKERERRLEMDREREREREKQEREQEQERQRLAEKQRTEQALNKHFEESLKRAQKQAGWNFSSMPPPARGSEEERKRAEQEHLQQLRHMSSGSAQARADARDRVYYQSSRSSNKPEYPPPAHSRIPTSKSDKMPPVHPSLSKGEVNVYGYPAYQPHIFTHEPKNKSSAEHHKHSQGGSLVVTKGGSDRDRDRDMLPNPPPLMSELKNSVIVKHDAKNQHHLESRVPMAHSPSPKLRADMMGHYLQSPGGSHKGSLYEYRSPTQSPHHLPHAPSPHHLQPENLGKAHHRPSAGGQLPSPHHQRQSPHSHPHSQPHPSPEMRYRTGGEQPQTMIYPTNAKNSIPASYSYIAPTTAVTHYTVTVNSATSNAKPKVSSPAPHHMYGKPGIIAPTPATRAHEIAVGNPIPLTSKPPLSSSISPSPYQQVSQYHAPHPGAVTMQGQQLPPPPAHSSNALSNNRTSSMVNYDRIFSGGAVPGALSVKPSIQHGTSPPTAASAPSPVARIHPQYMPGVTHASQNIPAGHSVQTQPLDLGVSSNKYDNSTSPKRKAQTSSNSIMPICLEVKKRRVDNSPQPPNPSPHPQIGSHLPIQQQQQPQQLQQTPVQPQNLPIYAGQQQPQLARVSEPSPLVTSAATTITTVVNTATTYRGVASTAAPLSKSPSVLAETLPDVSVTAVAAPTSANGSERPPSLENASLSVSGTCTNSSAINSNNLPPTSEPTTPVKSVTPTNVDSEKSNSPVPSTKSSSSGYPVRHLKKAWLQRHTDGDVEDTTGVVGSGSCVSLPLNLNNMVPVKETTPVVTSLHSIGSMAVNSINKTKSFQSKSNNRKTHKESSSLNGHQTEANKNDDSSSSDQERGRKSPPKRKPPKMKRKKGAGAPKKSIDEKKQRKVSGSNQAASESGSDSDKESISDKDSDSGASTSVSGNKKPVSGSGTSGSNSSSSAAKDKEPRKRGRRPKTKNDKGEEPRAKKSKDDLAPQRDPFRKPPVGQLKKTGESFLQDGPCFEVAPKLAKCRECRWTPNQRSKNMPNIFCRFYAFRKLRYTKNGQLAIAGFSDPHKDALEDDLKLWLPAPNSPPSDLDLDTARFILKQVGDHFCNLLLQEKDAQLEHMSDDKTIAWKRVVQGVREMCDVCETTLFNFHWACGKCGFVVCLDCYKGRKSGTIKIWGEVGKDRDDFSWLLCTNRQAHEYEKLMLTQIIAGDCLQKLGRQVHDMRELWNIEQCCECPISKEIIQKSNGQRKEMIKSILAAEFNGSIKKEEMDDIKPLVNGGGGNIKDEKGGLNWFAEVALSAEEKKSESGSDDESNFSTLRELLIRPSHKPNGSRAGSPVPNPPKKKNSARLDTLDEVISSVIEDSVPKPETVADGKELKHFVPRDNALAKTRGTLPIRIMTLTESKLLYPDTPHSWLCDGKLLRLGDTTHVGNFKIFQDQWKRGQPVLVSDVSKHLSKDLWTPDAFSRDFGDEKNDLVNCMNGSILVNQPMRKFWEGFEHFTKRIKDEKGNPMLLKLKDWPPGEDFAELLPSRFADLMKVLPLTEYTHRNGKLNLASRLPECFVRPDLGPKMYIAYGSALHPSKGTTNLHLDISDAVNVMVHVGIPKDSDTDEHIKEAFRAIDEAGCDILTRRRVRDKGELPGALWHIYNARDADKIRDLLNKVVVEKGGILKPNHDPIHDQSCYLDGALRERLYKEYGVEGYAIVQCLGDAVFIPAGAPHQVRNLHNCIKVAEDFVSPENVSHCFHLTQEFRDLSDTHSNHEDKLQIKNIIFHAIKDALSSLKSILNKHIKSERDATVDSRNGNGSNNSAINDTQQHNATLDSKAEPS